MKVLYADSDSFVFGTECLELNSKNNQNKEFAFPSDLIKSIICQTYIDNQEIIKYNTLFVNLTFRFIMFNNIFSNKTVDTRHIMEFLAKYLWSGQIQLESQELRILALQNFLNFKKISYLFVNTVCPLQRTISLDLNDSHFYKLDSDSFFDFSMMNYLDERQSHGHFTRIVHEAYAKMLHEYSNKVDL